jgi:hypothetical protein
MSSHLNPDFGVKNIEIKKGVIKTSLYSIGPFKNQYNAINLSIPLSIFRLS